MDVERLAKGLLVELNEICPEELSARYKHITPEMPQDALLEAVCRSRGFILAGNEPDTERAARIVLDEYRAGKIARVTLDRVNVPGSGSEEETNDGAAE